MLSTGSVTKKHMSSSAVTKHAVPFRRFKQVKSSFPSITDRNSSIRKTGNNQDLVLPEAWEGGELESKDLQQSEEEEEKGI